MSNERFKFKVWDKQERILHENVGAWDDSFIIQGADLEPDYFETIPAEMLGIADGDLVEITLSDRFIMMQCVGYPDRDCQLVYEGDIVDWKGNRAYVRFVNGQWGLFCNDINSWQYDTENVRFDRVLKECVIVGNMYQEAQ